MKESWTVNESGKMDERWTVDESWIVKECWTVNNVEEWMKF